MWYASWIDQRGSEVLDRGECARLLALGSGGVGRLGIVVDGQPVVVPLNYRTVHGEVVARIGPGTILSTVGHEGAIVAFEIDSTPDDGRWWSVVVQGLARLDDGGASGAGPVPAVPEPGEATIRIRTDVLTGRRFSPYARPT